MHSSFILGTGHYVPDNIITNNDLIDLLNTSDKWIQERTGIKERRWVTKESGDTAATMGYKAAKALSVSLPHLSQRCSWG